METWLHILLQDWMMPGIHTFHLKGQLTLLGSSYYPKNQWGPMMVLGMITYWVGLNRVGCLCQDKGEPAMGFCKEDTGCNRHSALDTPRCFSQKHSYFVILLFAIAKELVLFKEGRA